MSGDAIYGYGREGAVEAHIVRDVSLRQAWCGVGLPSIPLHQMTPARVCSRCRREAGNAAPAPDGEVFRPVPGRRVSMTLLLHAAVAGQVERGADFRYRLTAGHDVDDLIYKAQDKGLLVLYRDGTPLVTDDGRAWIARNPVHQPTAPPVPEFREATR